MPTHVEKVPQLAAMRVFQTVSKGDQPFKATIGQETGTVFIALWGVM